LVLERWRNGARGAPRHARLALADSRGILAQKEGSRRVWVQTGSGDTPAVMTGAAPSSGESASRSITCRWIPVADIGASLADYCRFNSIGVRGVVRLQALREITVDHCKADLSD
jgi:hypothetical protein